MFELLSGKSLRWFWLWCLGIKKFVAYKTHKSLNQFLIVKLFFVGFVTNACNGLYQWFPSCCVEAPHQQVKTQERNWVGVKWSCKAIFQLISLDLLAKIAFSICSYRYRCVQNDFKQFNYPNLINKLVWTYFNPLTKISKHINNYTRKTKFIVVVEHFITEHAKSNKT